MACKQQRLLRRVAAGDNLDSLTAKGAKLQQKFFQCIFAYFIAPWVSNHSSAAAIAYPAHRIAERWPMVGRIPRLTFDQVVPENCFYILRVPLLNQKSRKVHAADQVAIACVPASAFKTVMNAEFIELRRNIAGAYRPPIANGRQSLAKLRSAQGLCPRPTICRVCPRQLTEISTPLTNIIPFSAAARRASSSPLTSS